MKCCVYLQIPLFIRLAVSLVIVCHNVYVYDSFVLPSISLPSPCPDDTVYTSVNVKGHEDVSGLIVIGGRASRR